MQLVIVGVTDAYSTYHTVTNCLSDIFMYTAYF